MTKQKKINITFDIEDIYGEKDILNDSLYEILSFCEENSIYVDIYITAIRVNTLLEHPLILNLLKSSDFINIGYHSNTHSFHPIAEQESLDKIKRIEELKFDLNKEKFSNTSGGIIDFCNRFNPTMFRCPAYCWTPDYFDFMKTYNMKYTTLDLSFNSVFQYKGITILPALINPIEKIKNYENMNTLINNYDCVSIYLHPSRLIYNDYWDRMIYNTYRVINHRDIYADYKQRISLVKQLLLYIKNNYNIFSFKNVTFVKDAVQHQEIIKLKKQLEDSMISKWNWSQITTTINKEYHISRFKDSLESIVIGHIEF